MTQDRLQNSLKQAEAIRERRKSETDKSFIYFVQCHQFVKIGIAIDPQKRLSSLQVGCPYKLTLLRTIPVSDTHEYERDLHLHLSQYSETGEWFHMPEDVLEALLNIKEEVLLELLDRFPRNRLSLNIPPYASDVATTAGVGVGTAPTGPANNNP